MLAGYLQNGESIIMKRATVLWTKNALKEGLDFKLLDLVHDEWVVETYTEKDAHRLGTLMSEALVQVGLDLDLLCPLAGEYEIGKTWKEIH